MADEADDAPTLEERVAKLEAFAKSARVVIDDHDRVLRLHATDLLKLQSPWDVVWKVLNLAFSAAVLLALVAAAGWVWRSCK